MEERSTGPLLDGVLFFVGGGDTLGEGTEDEVVRALRGRKGLSVAVESGVVVGGGVGVGTVVAGLVLGGIGKWLCIWCCIWCCLCAAAAAAAATLCRRERLWPKDGFRMLSMEKGSGLRWGCGLCCCCCCCCWAAAAASGRKGWKRRGGAGRAVGEPAGMEVMVAVIPVIVGECEPEEAGEDGSGVSVTRISGLGGHDDIMAETASAGAEEASFSEWGGLAGSTISTGRLSRLIMASLFLSTRQRCPCLSVGRSSTTSPHENWQRRRGERPTAQ